MADAKLSTLTGTSVPDLADLLYSVDVSDTTDGAGGSSRQLTLTRALGLLNHVCQGRLTLTSGTPVTTSDVTTSTSVYFTPFNGNYVSLYDGTRWRMYSFTELTLALGTLTSGKNYDVFLYDNSGTLTLESLVWTNDTTRATALTTQDGVYVKTGATTRRYLGTFRTISTTETADSGGGTSSTVGGKRFLWNLYNRARRPLMVIDTTSTWTYATTTFRIARAQTAPANCVEFVRGLSLDAVRGDVTGTIYMIADGGEIRIGLDGATEVGVGNSGYSGSTDVDSPAGGSYCGVPSAGYHYLAWLERASAGTATFAGNSSGGRQSGLVAEVWG